MTDHAVAASEQFRARTWIGVGAGFHVLAAGRANLMTGAGGAVVLYPDTEVYGELTAGNDPAVCPPPP